MAKSLEKKPKMESMKKFINAYSVLFVVNGFYGYW